MPPVKEELGERPAPPERPARAPEIRPRTPVTAILSLQRSAGNQATMAALSRPRRAVLQRLVGTVEDHVNATVPVRDWNGVAFAPSTRTIKHGTKLVEARKTEQDDQVAYVK